MEKLVFPDIRLRSRTDNDNSCIINIIVCFENISSLNRREHKWIKITTETMEHNFHQLFNIPQGGCRRDDAFKRHTFNAIRSNVAKLNILWRLTVYANFVNLSHTHKPHMRYNPLERCRCYQPTFPWCLHFNYKHIWYHVCLKLKINIGGKF